MHGSPLPFRLPRTSRPPATTSGPTSEVLAKYDKSNNGRLEEDELAVKTADDANAARGDQETVVLSPFQVEASTSDIGYDASSTLSGTRLNAKIEDNGSSITVVTKQQMSDFAMLDANDVFNYEVSTEGTGNYTQFEVDRNGMVTDQIQNNPQGANRIRGGGEASIALDNVRRSGRVPIDPINIDAIEISRGPNSSIFGLGEGSGTVNLISTTANLNRPSTAREMRNKTPWTPLVSDLSRSSTSINLGIAYLDGKTSRSSRSRVCTKTKSSRPATARCASSGSSRASPKPTAAAATTFPSPT